MQPVLVLLSSCAVDDSHDQQTTGVQCSPGTCGFCAFCRGRSVTSATGLATESVFAAFTADLHRDRFMFCYQWIQYDCSKKFSPATLNRWRTVVRATWKYDDPRLNMSLSGCALVWHVQPRTNYRVSYVLSSDQLQESWIICKLKSFSPICICMI